MATKIHFQILNTHRKDKRFSLYMRVYSARIGEKRYQVPDIYLFAKDWDKHKERCKTSDVRHEKINRIIDNYKRKAEDIIFSFAIDEKNFSFESFENDFLSKSKNNDVHEFIEKYISSNYTHKDTLKRWRTSANRLKQFKPVFHFNDFNYDLYRDFETFLQSKGYALSVINKSIRDLKLIETEAEKRELTKRNYGRTYKLRTEDHEVKYLEKEELIKLINLYKSNRYKGVKLESLKAFLFSCFTGLRISDIQDLKVKHINGNILEKEQVKTINGKKEKILKHITGFAYDLIDFSKSIPEIKIFGTPNNAQINEDLKEFDKECNINKNITFHWGRYTYLTLFRRATNDPFLTKKVANHKNISTTDKYYLGYDPTEEIEAGKKYENFVFGSTE